MGKNKKRFKFSRLLKLFFLFLIIYFCIKYKYLFSNITQKMQSFESTQKSVNTSNYEIIKKDTNENYSGIGQTKVSGKDGYFTTFTTTAKNEKTYIEYKQNGTSSWSNKSYWGGTMAENGCGITVLAIILSGYNKNYTPENLREKYYPVLNYSELSEKLYKTYGINNSDFYYDSTHLSEKSITEHLLTNRPIIICVWNKPSNNRWTTASHYMALLASDGEKVYVSNPNGGENDEKSSGWYDINEITPYIAKAIYIESY